MATSVSLSTPPSWFFSFPPASDPAALPPPPASDGFHLRSPFTIDSKLYNLALNPLVPLTFATVYVATIKSLNKYNRENGYKPWAISRWSLFHPFVVLHNILLAVYSAITCVAMLRTMHVSIVSPFGPAGLAGTADSLCKMHGPRGFGDAVTYNATTKLWTPQNILINLGADNFSPDGTDVGRIWNEGLAFWGWFFYLSKFYEVVDTLIILAKGKRSSTLQTYHHAGAMLSMWAGIRYMSVPIWLFCLLNSGVHTIMYTYYTLSTVGIKVPLAVKRTITTMQISQFLIGETYAGLHLFVHYTVPLSITNTIASAFSGSISSMAAAASEDPVAWLKKLALRAGGAEGLAERLTAHNLTDAAGSPLEHKSALETLKHMTRISEVRCIETSGQALAIWVNMVYLAPLTFLFVRFFIRTYFKAATPKRPRSSFSASAQKAARRMSDVVEATGKRLEDSVPSPRPAPVKEEESAVVDESHIDGLELPAGVSANGSLGNDYITANGEKVLFRTETKPEGSDATITREVVEDANGHISEIVKEDGKVIEQK